MPLVPPTPRRRAYVALPVAWAVVILLLTLTPADQMPPQPRWELLSFDTAAHAAVFWLLAVLSYFSARRQQRWPWLRQHAFIVLLLAGIAFGFLIEVLQTTMHVGRYGEWTDGLSDAIGMSIGLLMSKAAMRRLN
ncbi:VanZ family protein [Hymenobacter sp. J193]|uniref:VanZ family protein n=1 Tax=Hymenobacter sp. J193 TaxID=2898429 RepID=UPI0021510CEB|nr:VanZ family protein [Hymenobacter sp. J193]MCR5888493.1 VanZ family protein [Hymenobacter sp. J193]